MSNIKISQHAEIRMQQRAIRLNDIDYMYLYATRVKHTSLLMTDKNAKAALSELKAIGDLEGAEAVQRLHGKCHIICDNTLVTCYHAKNKQIKSMLKDRG